MAAPDRGGETNDDDELEEGDVVIEALSGGVVIKIYGNSRAWIYSDSPRDLEQYI